MTFLTLWVVQYTRTVTVRISHVSIRTDGKDRQQEVDNSGLWFIERGILHLEFAFLGFCACVGLWFIERGILQLECAFLAVRIVIIRCTLRMSAEVLDMCDFVIWPLLMQSSHIRQGGRLLQSQLR